MIENLRNEKDSKSSCVIYKWLLCFGFLCFASLASYAQSITGIVVDGENEPIIGVTVVLKGSQKGTVTNYDGEYKINISSPSDILVFSYMGYDSKEVTVGNQTVINVKMEESPQQLDEVVVVGYGTMKKRDLSGSVAMVDAQKRAREQPNTVQDYLRTGVPGLTMGISTDAKGNSGNIIIRGKNSFSAGTAPLLVLDGVIYYGELTDINPNDIERIDVLKDGSSAAVYGAKAANGVILVTTKKGKENKPTIRFATVLGAAFRNATPKYNKGHEYVDFRQTVMEAKNMYNSSKPSNYFKNPANMDPDELETWMGSDNGDRTDIWLTRLGLSDIERRNYMEGNVIDWEKLTFKTAFNQDYSVSISGHKDDTKYYTSLNYLKNESNVIGGGYSAVRARLNLESVAAKIVTYGINAQFTVRDQGYTSVSASGYRTVSPYGDMYDENGNYTYYVNGNLNQYNPFIDKHYTNNANDITNLNASTYMRIDLPFNIALQTTYAPRFEWINTRNHRSTKHPLWNTEASNTASRSNTRRFYWQLDNTLKWNKEFGKNSFDVTFLWNLEKLQNWSESMTAKGILPNDELGSNGMGFNTQSIISSDDNYRTGDALMGRLHYAFDTRYIFTATVRRDGYSAFGQNNPRATFPSFAGAWIFSEESFFPKQKYLNYGKLRLSWGKNGNRDIGMYDALMRLDPRKYYSVDALGTLVDLNTYYAYRMANANLKWESTTAYNAGLDFSLFSSRITGSIDVYKKYTNDLLVSRKLPDITGYETVLSNIGQVQNLGGELLLNSTNISTNNFIWNTTFTFYKNKNRINKLYGLMVDIYDDAGNIIGQKESDDTANGRFIGKSMDEIWDYNVVGVYQEEEYEEARKYGLWPGDFKLQMAEGQTKPSADDKIFQGSKTPTTMLTLKNSFTFFDNIFFSFSFYSHLGHKQNFSRALNNNALLDTVNQLKLKYWTPDNRSNEYARLSSATQTSFGIWRKADFIRLDNISLGYSFPKKIIKNWKIEGLNINTTVNNAKYWSKWPGEDPENSGSNTPIKVYFGVNVTF